MRINDFVPPAAKPLADFSVTTDAPPPPEMPPEVNAAFSLAQLHERAMKIMNRNLDNALKLSSDPRWQMWSQQVRQCGAVMSHCMAALPAEQRQELEAEQKLILDGVLHRPAPPEIEDEYRNVLTSSNDFFDKLLELIDLIKNGYLDGYEHILKAYSDFFTDFNKEITAKLTDWIHGIDDGKAVRVNVRELREALDNLIRKYTHPSPDSVLYPDPKKGGVSWKEADDWRKALGLPESCLKQNADGTYCVVMDIGPLQTMRNSVPSGGDDWVTWDTAKFQAWQTGFNAQEERMKNMLQSLTQKYSNANSYHDNFNKTLSSHLNQYADMLKAMLNF